MDIKIKNEKKGGKGGGQKGLISCLLLFLLLLFFIMVLVVLALFLCRSLSHELFESHEVAFFFGVALRLSHVSRCYVERCTGCEDQQTYLLEHLSNDN